MIYVCGSAANSCLLLDNLKSKDDDQNNLVPASKSLMPPDFQEIYLGTKSGLMIYENNLLVWGEDESE